VTGNLTENNWGAPRRARSQEAMFMPLSVNLYFQSLEADSNFKCETLSIFPTDFLQLQSAILMPAFGSDKAFC